MSKKNHDYLYVVVDRFSKMSLLHIEIFATKVLFRRNMQEKKFKFSKSTLYSLLSRCM
jgi:hypothetical protein